ncbi:DNA polymerase zeta catalytic subunit isoform X3 [Telopea speciosissima]|uniref:DNA polymerase zeta catalytic subunit isoform X3 n=1 Tax=Telopea speciosissima TaxID=54955 RepID=UPI001CC354E3|nr:DNA polymerase zeta catalytic subunit isoform X3 [Telopea speciosissima]
MEKSQSGENVFSLRIVSIDYYMAPPIPDLDICYSSFQGGKVNEVPVIRIYGSTPAGQKTCLHVHRALPYFYVPCSEASLRTQEEGNVYVHTVALAIEKALKLKGSFGSKRQHVHGCSLVRARKLYGYHSQEELFVKIYLYYPHEAGRVANLLLGGAVLDKSFQPHESHIPYLLQFLQVDYNLYGMGLLHLSMVKFRHPLPDEFIPRAAHFNVQHRQESQKLSASMHLQADSSGDACLSSCVWIASTIPSGWTWPCSIEVDAWEDMSCIKRQSSCELEGDATVDDILNQQVKVYSSLSQTHSEVKMVQSLIPIWEEEFERTGICQTSMSPDPSKPLPENVLRSLSHGLEFESTLLDLCEKAKNLCQNILLEESEKFVQSIKSLSEAGNAVESVEQICTNNSQEESSKFDGMPSLEGDAGPDLCPVNQKALASETTEISDTKVVDEEALGLLRWFSSSQAAEELNTDDVLVHESILSPLLPKKSIDKFLENANFLYENESQQECQDILDSVEDLVDLEDLTNSAAHSTHHSRLPQTSSTDIIPQVDGLYDDQSTTPASDTSEEHHCKLERSSSDQVVQDTLICPGDESMKKPLRGSLTFTTPHKVNTDMQSSGFNLTDLCSKKTKDGKPTSSLARNTAGCSDALVSNTDKDIFSFREANKLTECSVRELMRKKRCYRIGPSENRSCTFKKALLEEQKEEKRKEETSLYPKRLEFHAIEEDEQVMMPTETPNKNPFFTDQKGEVCVRSSSMKTHAAEGLEQTEGVSSVCLASSSVEHARFCDGGHIVRNNLSENGGSGEEDAPTCLPLPEKSLPTVIDSERRDIEYIEMAFKNKPPTIEWTDGISEDPPPASSLHDCDLPGVMENYEGTLHCSSNLLDIKRVDDGELLPFFVGNYQEEKEAHHKSYGNTELNIHQETVLGVPTHYQNDGSFLYLLTPIFSPPPVDSVHKWLSNSVTGTLGEKSQEQPFPRPDIHLGLENVKNNSSGIGEISSELHDLPVASPSHQLISQSSSAGAFFETSPVSDVKHSLDQFSQDSHGNLNTEIDLRHTVNTPTVPELERTNMKGKACGENWQDISQISAPDKKPKLTPLSQTGFRDPASIGAGQQLTLLSIEVLAESRGNLRPDPRIDAVNVIVLAVQEDNCVDINVLVLLHSNDGESCQRNPDGITGCKVLVTSEEKQLFYHFVQIIVSLDPDILMGWEIQGGSLGFLAERAAHLGVRLLNKISRTPLPETKIAAKDSSDGEKSVPDNLLPESLFGDSILENTIIEDEWGRTHASGVHVGGRIVLNIWRLMRDEIKLNMYTLESVAEAVLRRKIPSIPCRTLTQWFSSGPSRARFRCIEYVIERSKLNLEIMNQLDMINRTSELARVFGIDFFSVLSRGSQYRVESMLLRLAHTQNYLAISPGNQQVASQPAMECLPLVMEPESGFYADPVVVLDFQSLYPSMIIGYNLCYCTCLGKVVPSKVNTLGVSSFSPDPQLLTNLKHQILLTPNGVMYVPPKVRKGILPRLLEEILSTRIMVKQAMKKLTPPQRVLFRIFNARQLALKLIANVTYGYTAAGFSGRMPCAELADSIVQCGRRTLETAISFVNMHDKWNARVIYGDTDSMFVLLKGRTVKESFKIGQEIAAAITAMNPHPITLKMEKVYHPCFLLTKKRYVGYSFESPEQAEPTFDAKGIETIRRDTCGAVAKTLEQSLRIFFTHQDISKVKSYLQRQWTKILRGRVSLQDFVFAKEVRLGTYSSRASSLPPAAIVATKAMRIDPRSEPRYAERIPYVVVHGEPGSRLVDMVVDPLDVLRIDSPYRLNDLYYIQKQIIPALQRVFGLIGADLNQWFLEMPRPVMPVRPNLSKRQANQQRTRIDYYYLSKSCIVCGELVQASSHLCDNCSKKQLVVATAAIGRTSKLERDIQHLAAICQHCGGGDWVVESGVKCMSLSCAVFYERRKVQKELQALSSVAMEAGFYPKCMVEWF